MQSFINSGIGFIAQVQKERARQIRPRSEGGEGCTAEMDDRYINELAMAAVSYGTPWAVRKDKNGAYCHHSHLPPATWPWHPDNWKPGKPLRIEDRQREIIKAAALHYADWDRLERARLRNEEHKRGRGGELPQFKKLVTGEWVPWNTGDTLAAAAITEPEDMKSIPFNGMFAQLQSEFNERYEGGERCRIEASDEQVKQAPRHTCGKDGPHLDYHSQVKKMPGCNPPTETPFEKAIRETVEKNAQKDPYAERVRLLAEKMAIDHFEKHIAPSDYPVNGWNGLTKTDKELWIIAEVDRARIAVAEMAEQFDNGFSCGEMDQLGHAGYEKDACKIRLGLIPDTEQEQQKCSRCKGVKTGDNPYYCEECDIENKQVYISGRSDTSNPIPDQEAAEK